MSARAPILIFAVGNPSRGDDALGWHFAERARDIFSRQLATSEIEILTDFQFQIEHALDLEGRAHVIFVDASVAAPAPCALTPLVPNVATSASAFSHALEPGQLLQVLESLGKPRPPRVEVLAIRGESFELGEPLSPRAARHLDEALRVLSHHLGHDQPRGLRLTVGGVVQGVGFRPFVARTARALGLTGCVSNGPDGVMIDLWGAPEAIERFVTSLQASPPPGADIRGCIRTPIDGTPPVSFDIMPSIRGAASISIPPDTAPCADCQRDIADPSNRRFDHAFASCAVCGPRLSIVTALPFDRERTTMATFPMCQSCAREYASDDDRRYHAQTLCCPDCGPQLVLLDARRTPQPRRTSPAILDATAALLKSGAIVAIQGLGGFHLACDATSAEAVARLRQRKQRDAKPFAVMVADSAAAEELIAPDAWNTKLHALLTSPAAPIVLAPQRTPSPLAAHVCAGTSRVGICLPSTPLHARLLTRLLGTPLVMTSGNISGEPIVIDHDEAFLALSDIADYFLLHDRPIARRVEDSVVACDPQLPTRMIRRARGYGPTPIRLPVTSPEPLLAVGGHMKNTAAIVIGDECWLTPHLGDLDTHTAERAWVREIESFQRLLGVHCDVVVHDAHPDYASTRYAAQRAGARRIAVQHHHAHTLAVLAECRTLEPVLAVAFDGTGWGPDGTAWGGEILRVDGLAFSRPTALRPIPLPGGERALREVWRAAYGLLFDAFGPEAPAVAARFPMFATASKGSLAIIHTALNAGVGVVQARGLGRYFDAFGALMLGYTNASFEGEIPMRLEDFAAPRAAPYTVACPTTIGTTTTLEPSQEIDLRPTTRAFVADLLAGTPHPLIAARLHATIVAAVLETVERHHLAAGVRRIVLTGGAFQNRILQRAFRERLGDVLLDPVAVPVHDGGIALGQALAGVLTLNQARSRPCV
jgi:hydrogenase maturation protein HypF